MKNHRLSAVSLLIAAFWVGAGCTEQRASQDASDTASRRASFDSASAAFHQALRTNDTESFLSYIGDDVILMPPGEPAVNGKERLRTWYAGFLSQYKTASLELSKREVFVTDEWAVETGAYEWGLAPAAGGAPVVDRGNYMQLWRSQPDGQWRFVREVWNSSVPASTAPAT